MSGPSRFAIQPWSAMSKVTDGRNSPVVYVPIDRGPMTTGAVVGPSFVERLPVGRLATGHAEELGSGERHHDRERDGGHRDAADDDRGSWDRARSLRVHVPGHGVDKDRVRDALQPPPPRGMNPTVMLACVMPLTVELTRTSPGLAAAHRRAAMLTARPM